MARKKSVSTEDITKFYKSQFLRAKKYVELKDIIEVLLKDDELYSFDEVDTLVDEYLKREVK